MELSDLEICKKIAEIEYGEAYVDGDDAGNFINLNHPMSDRGGEMYNPLTDDALLWNLAKKYRVSVMCWEQWQREQCKSESDVIAHIEMGNDIWCPASVYFRDGDDSLNKAICLAIIEAHKESV